MKLYAVYYKSGNTFVSNLFQAETDLVALRNFKFHVEDALKQHLALPKELELRVYGEILNWKENPNEVSFRLHEADVLASGDQINDVYRQIYRENFDDDIELEDAKPKATSEAEFVGENVK